MFSETRAALVDFMERSGKSQRQISRETGLSQSVISQFLNGCYAGDNEEVAKSINQYLTIGKERLNTVSKTPFYPELYNTREVLFTCLYAHQHNDITLVSGDAGAGKTTALRYYAETNTGGIFITQLVGTNRLIIIDEADHLSLDALQAVRNLNDLAGVGIVLSGNDKIYRQMKAGRRSYEFDQLRTRIVIRKKIYNDYKIEEMEAMFPGLSESCIGYLLKLAQGESLRTAKKLYNVAAEFAAAQGSTLTVRHLRDTHRQLLGEVCA